MRFAVLILLTFVGLFSCSSPKKPEQSKSTVSKNVSILPAFHMEKLDRDRIVRIYLPENYTSSSESYPVLYAHDGQNLFDDSTSYVGEWGIDESLIELEQESGLRIIVVGIDNGRNKRMNELSPWENSKFGSAEGDAYLDFIINQVKPYVDSNYRTLADRENSAIMGSSMGGLMSHYAIYKYPEIFSKAIIFSPSYWYADEVWDFTSAQPLPADAKIWLEIGEKEGNAVNNTNRMHEVILEAGHSADNIIKQVDPEGEHNEDSWQRQFVPAIKWIFEN